MSPRKPQTRIFKHDDLATDPVFEMQTVIAGFSTGVDVPWPEHEMFKKHFRSDFVTIFLVTKGEMEISINLKPYTVSKNHLIVMPPNAIKQLVRIKNEVWVTNVSFTTDFLGKIGMPKNISELMEYFSSRFSPIWILSEKDAGLIHTLTKELNRRSNDCRAYPYGRELLFHTFNIFLYEMAVLSRTYAQAVTVHVSRKENLVINFTSLVQKQFKSRRNVRQYAEQLNVTPKYLTETVKEISGKTAGEIIDDFVLLEARLLLDDPALSIAEVANTLHFSDQSFFGKFFKRHTGLSPRAYRRNS